MVLYSVVANSKSLLSISLDSAILSKIYSHNSKTTLTESSLSYIVDEAVIVTNILNNDDHPFFLISPYIVFSMLVLT